MDTGISRHAARRAAQRGVSAEDLGWLLREADVEPRAGGRATFLMVSDKNRCRAPNDKIARYGVLLSDDNTIITVMPVHASGRDPWRKSQ